MTFAELHCRSYFSFLDGASAPEELVARAHELGYELILAHSLNNVEREEKCIRRLLAHR